MNDVEARGLQVMKNIGLACFGDLGNIPISQAFPDSSVSSGEHFEFDYFVIVEDICFIGEITDRSSEKDLRDKHKKFRRNLDLMRTASSYEQAFRAFSVPDDQRYMFKNIRDIKGFLIANPMYKFNRPAGGRIGAVSPSPLAGRVERQRYD